MPNPEQERFARSEAARRVYDLLVRMAARHVVRVGPVRPPRQPAAGPLPRGPGR